MRASTAITLVSTLCLTGRAQLVIPFQNPDPATPDRINIMSEQQSTQHQQTPLNAPGIQMPPSGPSSPDPVTGPTDPRGPLTLSDTISRQRTINTFAGYTRDVVSVAERLEDEKLNTTVLAPLNTAVWALPRKPWEDPREYAALGSQAYEGDDGFGRARENLKRFTEAHIVPASPWEEGEKVESLGGAKLWWERKDGKMVVQPGGVEVQAVVSRAANGEVWILEKVLNYA